MSDVVVREARPGDAPGCAEIYRHYVTSTAVTFELVPPDADQMRARIAAVQVGHTWLVAVREGRILGYAYAQPFAERAAYRWACEVSVYVDPASRGEGLGSRLYSALLGRLAERGMQVAVARISQPNPSSDAMHSRFGFQRVGVLRRIGFKHGAWHDVALEQLELAAPSATPVEPS